MGVDYLQESKFLTFLSLPFPKAFVLWEKKERKGKHSQIIGREALGSPAHWARQRVHPASQVSNEKSNDHCSLSLKPN